MEGLGPSMDGSWGISPAALNCSDCHLFIMIPIPSIMPSKRPPITALVAIAIGPFLWKTNQMYCLRWKLGVQSMYLAAIMPPAPNPDMIEFQGSSFCLMYMREHSIEEKHKHQAANPPPKTGPRSRILTNPPWSLLRTPAGACRAPETMPKSDPPTHPIAKAPPQSLKILQGLSKKTKKGFNVPSI